MAFADIDGEMARPLALALKDERPRTGRVVITCHGRPAGVLIGFASEEDRFDYRLENDPRFLQRIQQARSSLRSRRGSRLEDVEWK